MGFESIWAGASVAPPIGSRIVSVRGAWIVPFAWTKEGALPGVSYIASSWIGIDDGDPQRSNDILQAGVDVVVSSGGGLAVRPWYQWWPDDTHYLPPDEFLLSVDNQLAISITAETNLQARVVFENLTRDERREYPVAPTRGQQLRGVCAEWMVEAVSGSGTAQGPPPQQPVTFTNCRALTGGGQALGPDAPSATLVNIVENGQTLAQATRVASDVTVRVAIPIIRV